jgi:hypothetical protein
VSKSGFTEQKLNLTLALCAVLISIASFYATYLQASAADKQVKAMTLPLLQYGTGNVDDESHKPVINFSITNGGVGPALIKQVRFKYNNQTSANIYDFINYCCSKEYKEYTEFTSDRLTISGLVQGSLITSSLKNVILPAQDKLEFFKLYKGELSADLWDKLNVERRNLSVELCYCSLLDECYVTEKRGVVESVASCPIDR